MPEGEGDVEVGVGEGGGEGRRKGACKFCLVKADRKAPKGSSVPSYKRIPDYKIQFKIIHHRIHLSISLLPVI